MSLTKKALLDLINDLEVPIEHAACKSTGLDAWYETFISSEHFLSLDEGSKIESLQSFLAVRTILEKAVDMNSENAREEARKSAA
jgi:hypothetical protein